LGHKETGKPYLRDIIKMKNAKGNDFAGVWLFISEL
jgi:hypothetical protein